MKLEELEKTILEQRRTFSGFTSASRVSAESLKRLKERQILDESSIKILRFFHLLARHWPMICGRQLARHLRPLGIQGRTLWVEASSGLWVEQASLYESELLGRLRECLPRIRVERMRFRAGPFLSTYQSQAEARKNRDAGPRNFSAEAEALIQLLEPSKTSE